MSNDKPLGRPPIYGERTRNVKFVCPDSVNEALEAEASERKVSRSRIVVEALRRFLRARLAGG